MILSKPPSSKMPARCLVKHVRVCVGRNVAYSTPRNCIFHTRYFFAMQADFMNPRARHHRKGRADLLWCDVYKHLIVKGKQTAPQRAITAALYLDLIGCQITNIQSRWIPQDTVASKRENSAQHELYATHENWDFALKCSTFSARARIVLTSLFVFWNVPL